MKIGLDIMGGDFAPKQQFLGAIEACKALAAEQKVSAYWRSGCRPCPFFTKIILALIISSSFIQPK